MKGQNKRTFGVGSFHCSLVQQPKDVKASSKASCSSNAQAQPSNGVCRPSVPNSMPVASSSSQKAPTPTEEAKQSPLAAAKAVLIHVPQLKICPDDNSNWDYRLYSDDQDSNSQKLVQK